MPAEINNLGLFSETAKKAKKICRKSGSFMTRLRLGRAGKSQRVKAILERLLAL